MDDRWLWAWVLGLGIVGLMSVNSRPRIPGGGGGSTALDTVAQVGPLADADGLLPRAPAPPADAAGRRLVWAEEFEGPELNLSHWNVEVNCDGVRNNNERECYTSSPSNVFVDRRGFLVLRLLQDRATEQPFSSARINTRGRGDWKGGRVEARAKVPRGQGVWPAIWMLPTDEAYGGWPTSGEIDIMEVLGHATDTVHGTVHYGQKWPHNSHHGSKQVVATPDLASSFHVFSIEWEPDSITWAVDGIQYFTVSPKDCDWAPVTHWPFDQRFHLVMNVAMGGWFPGDPDMSVERGDMLVDYVRVYQ